MEITANNETGRDQAKFRQRLSYIKTAPDGWRAIYSLETYLRRCELEPSLVELVRVRVSQMNKCAFCIDIHTNDARAEGESEQRLYGLSAWWETPFYTDRERAALEWTETVTNISENGVPDAVYDQARLYFSEKELVDLTLAVIAINGFTRLAVSFRSVPGSVHRSNSPTQPKETEPLAR